MTTKYAFGSPSYSPEQMLGYAMLQSASPINTSLSTMWYAQQGVPGKTFCGLNETMSFYMLGDANATLQDLQAKLRTVLSLYAQVWVGRQNIPAQTFLNALDQLTQSVQAIGGAMKTASGMLSTIKQLQVDAQQTSLNTALAGSLQDLGRNALQGLIPLLPNQTDAQQSKRSTLQEYLKVINNLTSSGNYSLTDISEVLGQAADEL
jgi:hypothetical protein